MEDLLITRTLIPDISESFEEVLNEEEKKQFISALLKIHDDSARIVQRYIKLFLNWSEYEKYL